MSSPPSPPPLYSILGLSDPKGQFNVDTYSEIPQQAIKRAYRQLALKYHPDRNITAETDRNIAGNESSTTTTDLFASIAFAYEILSDAQRRKRYDISGEVPQSDGALGRSAGMGSGGSEGLEGLEKNMKAAMGVFTREMLSSSSSGGSGDAVGGGTGRGVDLADERLDQLSNYEILDLVHSRDVPEYMREIIEQGVRYLSFVLEDGSALENSSSDSSGLCLDYASATTVLLRHYRYDQLYALWVYEHKVDHEVNSSPKGAREEFIPEPTQSLFESDYPHSYMITYWDHPLQPGIAPAWSDTNGGVVEESLKKRGKWTKARELRCIPWEIFQRRKLVAIEDGGGGGNGGNDNMEAQYSDAPIENSQTLPDTGTITDSTTITDAQLRTAAKLVVAEHGDKISGWDIHTARRALESKIGNCRHGALDERRPMEILGILFEIMEDEEYDMG